jgi:hypothetical protein
MSKSRSLDGFVASAQKASQFYRELLATTGRELGQRKTAGCWPAVFVLIEIGSII